MAQGIIYMVDGDGLKRMTPSAPESEDRMQWLVGQYPELITDGDGDLLLIRREHPVGDGEAVGRWSLDHLFVTREGVPVLVELKRAVDTRLRREVVGQMLDYAANATAFWQAGSIAESFARTAGADRADAELARFIGDRDPGDFWEQVDSNLKAGRIKLVFVADTIPRELAIIVEFLNSQMRADVRAVELRWFSDGDGITTLAPRVIGETESAVVARSARALTPIDRDQWIEQRIMPHGHATMRGVERFVAMIEAEGGMVFVPTTQGSLMSEFAAEHGKRVYPMGVTPAGLIKLCLGYLLYRPAFVEERARQQLYDALTAAVGPLHTRSLSGEPGFAAALLNDDTITAQVQLLLRDVVNRARQG